MSPTLRLVARRTFAAPQVRSFQTSRIAFVGKESALRTSSPQSHLCHWRPCDSLPGTAVVVK